MTREEKEIALYCLKASSDYHSEVCEECIKYPNCDHTIQDDVTETIIKALEQEPCEDVVSREKVLGCFKFPNTKRSDFIEAIKKLPPVTPARPKGKLIKEFKLITDGYTTFKKPVVTCSKCGAENSSSHKNYCPNCGAEMESEE